MRVAVTKVTAIVSPSARPSPKRMPPKTPTRVREDDPPDDLGRGRAEP